MQFSSLKAFASFIRSMKLREVIVDTAGRGAVAAFYTAEAKERIGNAEKLQPYLLEATQDEREKHGFTRDETLLRTGELRDSIRWDHESTRKTIVGSTDEKAVWHEFGTGHLPARSFLGATAQEKNVEGFEIYNKIIGTWLGKGEALLHVQVERID